MTEERKAASLRAVGVYVRTLRQGRKVSRKQVETALAISPMTIVRLEHGNSDLRSTSMAAIVRYVGGSLDDVADLQLNLTVTEDAARYLALQRLQRGSAPRNDAPQPGGYPTTALITLLYGLRLVAKKGQATPGAGHVPFDPLIDMRITDADLAHADAAWKTVIMVLRLLKELGTTDEELQFLLLNPEIARECGDRLACTRLGMWTIEQILAKYTPHSPA